MYVKRLFVISKLFSKNFINGIFMNKASNKCKVILVLNNPATINLSSK